MPFLRERNGDWCPEKVIAFVGVLLPAFWIFGRFVAGTLGARPVMEVIHFTGDWTVRILWITLAVTPFARIFKLGRLMLARRILGVASFAYIICHLTLYTLDQMFDLAMVVSEIVHAVLSDHRLCRDPRTCNSGRDVDRRDGSPVRRANMEPPAQIGLSRSPYSQKLISCCRPRTTSFSQR